MKDLHKKILIIMAEARSFSLTACVDHLVTTFPELFTYLLFNHPIKVKNPVAFREFVTLSATTCNFKSEKSLEERQADVAQITQKHPNAIPVIILRAEESQMHYPNRKKFLIPAKLKLGKCFVSIWKVFYNFEYMSKKFSFISVVEHQDPIFEKPISSVYEEYKDEDGCLYIILNGEEKDVLTEPIPSNIKTWTFYL